MKLMDPQADGTWLTEVTSEFENITVMTAQVLNLKLKQE